MARTLPLTNRNVYPLEMNRLSPAQLGSGQGSATGQAFDFRRLRVADEIWDMLCREAAAGNP